MPPKQTVAIDNDFLQHLAETKGEPDDVRQMVQNFFDELGYAPLLHEFVYRREVQQNHPVIQELLNQNAVKIAPLHGSMLNGSPSAKRYYQLLIKRMYQDFMGKSYPCDVFSEWKAGESLGEVHSVVMCSLMNLPCLLSDDKGAKSLTAVVQKFSTPIDIFSRDDCKKALQRKELHTLKRTDLRRLCHN